MNPILETVLVGASIGGALLVVGGPICALAYRNLREAQKADRAALEEKIEHVDQCLHRIEEQAKEDHEEQNKRIDRHMDGIYERMEANEKAIANTRGQLGID